MFLGRSLRPALTGEALPPRPITAEVMPAPSWKHDLKMLIGEDDKKIIYRISDGVFELYDLAADPASSPTWPPVSPTPGPHEGTHHALDGDGAIVHGWAAAGYKNPVPTVDVIIESPSAPGKVVLIPAQESPPRLGATRRLRRFRARAWRRRPRREAKEETGLDVELVELFHCYSHPTRDPRQHTVSTVFIGRSDGTAVGGDDAAGAGVVLLDELPELAFDHATILDDYRAYRTLGRRPPPER
jgi:8-oxo-dGTP diphosphatase